MHTIKLQIQDSIYDHVMFLLKNLNTKELKIIEDKVSEKKDDEVRAYSDHTATTIEEWYDESEDEVWR